MGWWRLISFKKVFPILDLDENKHIREGDEGWAIVDLDQIKLIRV